MLTNFSKWDKENINIFFGWLYDCIYSYNVISEGELEEVYGVFIKNKDELDNKSLVSLTLYIFQRVLKNLEKMDFQETEIYGVVCFGIALKYLSDTINGDVISFLKEMVEQPKISHKKISSTEVDVLNMINYTIPINEAEMELSENFKEVLELITSCLE